MPARRLYASLAVAVVLAAAALLAFLVTDRPEAGNWPLTKVLIPKGSTYPHIARLLAERNVLKRPAAFRLLVLATRTGRELHHGEYTFPAPPSAYELWRKIVSGDVTRHVLTVPEGSNIRDIAKALGELELADPKAFLAAASAPALAARLGVPGKTLEGFLFPETYTLVKYMTEEEILEIMVRQFRRKFTKEMEEQAARAGFSLREIVTMASIIEKETGVDEEKPLVSAVIRRRLALGMPLQMDPTVIYGLGKFGGDLTRKDLRTPSPYNSYLNRGLPPGPITNPGLAALKAAISPADADFIYFVSRNDGSHEFSRTLGDHNRAVAAFQKGETAEN